MGARVVIDKDVLGWADGHEQELRKKYDKIQQVGKDPDLPQRSFDLEIAKYCERNDCDLVKGMQRPTLTSLKLGLRRSA